MSREIDIIEHLGRHLAHPGHLLHDTFYEPESRLILTTDMLVAGRHFNLDYFSPADLGWKAAAVNISDIAATGGRLKYLLVSLGLPDDTPMALVDALYEGLAAAAAAYEGDIVGGDTVGADTLTLNVTAVGELPLGHTPGRRDAARPGDVVIATGWHGLSEVGLQVLRAALPGYEAARHAHLRPEPRVADGLALSARHSRYALMDSSDGLADAAVKIGAASGVRVVLEAERVPIHQEVHRHAAESGRDALDIALYGGEDFELVAAVPADGHLPLTWTVIGYVDAAEEGRGEAVVQQAGQRTVLSLEKAYQHFAGGDS